MPTEETIYRTWYRDSRNAKWQLWCESRDPDDPYLIPTPDITTPVRYDVSVTSWVPTVSVSSWQPPAELVAKGHPSTWVDDDPTLTDLLADDASTFPDGHPCRDCDRLYKDHSTYDSNCRGWR